MEYNSVRPSNILQNREHQKELRMRIETWDPLYYGMKKLKMRGKDLSQLTGAVFSLLELEVLDLSPEREACLDFKLMEVPPAIGKLINLRILMLDTNELEDIPKEIALLQSLERLALSNNHLMSLPQEFCRLKNLKSLHLANNDFVHFPLPVCELKQIEFLDLSDNSLVVLPDQIGDLKNLHTLLLFINKIIKLPDSLCKLVEMRCLWLGKNQLRELPRKFGQLYRLDWVTRYTSTNLDGNPLIHPPIEVCRLGPAAIDRYFSGLEGRSTRNKERNQENTDRENLDQSISNHKVHENESEND
ncbi:hypothetical protein CHS0354_006305 [Potamilus streckersoni]|uniref:Leucine-rich repeat-containing protein n=1 Tax=Potamilus streckersoni TaxID=2493646 RepID=A0AAE0VQ99_9BIVA|nr:hypothetical protein CHS0354_006305 [Potamilus streckersoni]